MVKLSVLDYALIDEGKDAQKALQDSVTLAKLADRLGFKRIWFTEHHNVPAFACSSPELLMMHTLVSLIERNNFMPSVLTAIKIARIFNETVETVFIIEEDEA